MKGIWKDEANDASYAALALAILSESSFFAFSSSARRVLLRPFPPRLMKYVSILNPELGPLGETVFDARLFAMAAAFFVKSPAGGWVESVLTLETHRLFFSADPADFFGLTIATPLSVAFEVLNRLLMLLSGSAGFRDCAACHS